MVPDHIPSHLKKTLIFVKPHPIFNAPKVAALIVVQDGRNFRQPNLWVIEISVPRFVSVVIQENSRRPYIVTEQTSGT